MKHLSSFRKDKMRLHYFYSYFLGFVGDFSEEEIDSTWALNNNVSAATIFTVPNQMFTAGWIHLTKTTISFSYHGMKSSLGFQQASLSWAKHNYRDPERSCH